MRPFFSKINQEGHFPRCRSDKCYSCGIVLIVLKNQCGLTDRNISLIFKGIVHTLTFDMDEDDVICVPCLFALKQLFNALFNVTAS